MPVILYMNESAKPHSNLPDSAYFSVCRTAWKSGRAKASWKSQTPLTSSKFKISTFCCYFCNLRRKSSILYLSLSTLVDVGLWGFRCLPPHSLILSWSRRPLRIIRVDLWTPVCLIRRLQIVPCLATFPEGDVGSSALELVKGKAYLRRFFHFAKSLSLTRMLTC